MPNSNPLYGRRVLITGASQGFGLAVARHFARQGANLMLCARTQDDLIAAQVQLKAEGGTGRILYHAADVSDPGQVHEVVEDMLMTFGGIEALVCCAGVYGPKGPFAKVDLDEWVRTIEINLIGTVLPCREVLRHMIRQREGKIVILSGGGATKAMPNFSAYAASKTAIVRFAETLAEEVREYNIGVNTVAPGALNTRLLDEVLAAGREKVGQKFYDDAVKQKESGGTSFELGAELCAFLASSASDGITGKLISAIWDEWKDLPGKKLTDDIYTLRRLT